MSSYVKCVVASAMLLFSVVGECGNPDWSKPPIVQESLQGDPDWPEPPKAL